MLKCRDYVANAGSLLIAAGGLTFTNHSWQAKVTAKLVKCAAKYGRCNFPFFRIWCELKWLGFTAMKWLNRTAQVFTPGLLRDKTLDLKGRPNWCRFVNERKGSKVGRPFRSNSLGRHTPGLKTWAILLQPFHGSENQPIDPTPIRKDSFFFSVNKHTV